LRIYVDLISNQSDIVLRLISIGLLHPLKIELMKKFSYTILLCIMAVSCKTEESKSIHQIIPPDNVIDLFERYTNLWSEGNIDAITNDIYDLPISIYSQDSIYTLRSRDEVKGFLTSTFKNLESNNYGFSQINNWEYYREDEKYIIIEMNFTRFYKDSTVMGDIFKKATYILRKSDENLRISALLPHTTLDR